MYSETLTQRLGIGAPINNATLISSGPASATAGPIDMSKFHRAFFLIDVGTVVSGGSLSIQLIESASSSLSSPQNVGGTNGQLTLTTSNKQYSIEIRADELDAGYRYVGVTATETGGHDVSVTVVCWGDEANHKPGNANNDASVVTQNVV